MGKQADVARQAFQTSTSASLKAQWTIRLFEALYPRPVNDSDKLYFREIENKWIYVFQNSLDNLNSEIYADPSGWKWLREPGKQQSPDNKQNRRPDEQSGRFAIPDLRNQSNYTYYFYLSPVQLSPKSFEKLSLRQKLGYLPSSGPFTVRTIQLNENESFSFNMGNRVFDPDVWISEIKIAEAWPVLNSVLLVDPFAWVEDIQRMGYQRALALLDQYNEENGLEIQIARALQGVLAADDDHLGIHNELAEKLPWASKFNRRHPPKFVISSSLDDALNGKRQLHRTARPSQTEWTKILHKKEKDSLLSSNIMSLVRLHNVLDLRVDMHHLEMQALLELVFEFAEQISRWLQSAPYMLLESICMDQGGEALALSVANWAKATCRLFEAAPGRQFLIDVYKNGDQRLLKRLIQEAIHNPDQGWWEENGPLCVLFAFKAIEHAMGAIAVVEEKNFKATVKTLFGMKVFGLKWGEIVDDEVVRVWGKVLDREPIRLVVPEDSPLARAKEGFEKYDAKKWFSGVALGIGFINTLVALNEACSGEKPGKEKAKAALEAISFMGDASEWSGLSKGIVSNATRRQSTLEAIGNAENAATAFQRVGAAASAVSSVIEVWESGGAAGTAYAEGNYAEMAAKWGEALGHSVAVVSALITLVCASTPAGWITLAATLGPLIASWLAEKLKDNKWELVARHSIYGDKYLEDYDLCNDFYIAINAKEFGMDLKAQMQAITGLMASFQLTAAPGDALHGKIKVKAGYIRPESIFYFIWQIGYGGDISNPHDYVLIKAKLPVKTGILDWDVDFSSFNQKGSERIEWVGSWQKTDEFWIAPQLVGSGFSNSPPRKTSVLVQLDLYGDGKVRIPFGRNFQFDSGPLSNRNLEFQNYLSYTVDMVNQDVDMAVSAT
jgi:hypothetical protein